MFNNNNIVTKNKKIIEIKDEQTITISANIKSKKRIKKIIGKEIKKITTGLKNLRNSEEKRAISIIEKIEDEKNKITDDESVLSELTDCSNYENKVIEKCDNNNTDDDNDDNDESSIIDDISVEPNPVKFVERVEVFYPEKSENPETEIDNELIQLEVDTFNSQYKIKLRITKIYHNQSDVADKVLEKFQIRSKVIQLIISQTQTGKTGCMIEIINKYINNNKIPIGNIYIISGLSSTDWKKQVKARTPDSLESNIYHLNDLQKFKEAVIDKKNILLCVDEVQCACLKEQTISKLMEALGWTIDKMFENDIKIVQFSATPDGIIFGLLKKQWKEEWYSVHIMKEGDNYYGSKKMMLRNKIKQNKDLSGRDKNGNWQIHVNTDGERETNEKQTEDNILEMTNDILSFSVPKYSIIRTSGTNIQYIKENITNTINKYYKNTELLNLFDSDIKEYSMDGNIEIINELLKISPIKHTIILIKEKLKCSHTIVKTYIGVVYERYSKKFNDSFIIQGLLGRITGNDGVNDIICYTNLPSIVKYHKLFDSNFSKKSLLEIGWSSNSTKSKKNSTVPRNTYLEKFDVNKNQIQIQIDYEAKNKGYRLFQIKDLNEDDIKKWCLESGLPPYICINDIKDDLTKDDFCKEYGQHWDIKTKPDLTIDGVNNIFKEIGKNEKHNPVRNANGKVECCLASEKLKVWDYDELWEKINKFGVNSTHGIHNGLRTNKQCATRAWVGYDKNGNEKYILRYAQKNKEKCLPQETNDYIKKNPYIKFEDENKIMYSLLKSEYQIMANDNELPDKYYWKTLDGWLYLYDKNKPSTYSLNVVTTSPITNSLIEQSLNHDVVSFSKMCCKKTNTNLRFGIKEVYTKYENWCKINNKKPLNTQKRFKEEFEKIGYNNDNGTQGVDINGKSGKKGYNIEFHTKFLNSSSIDPC
jgi:hypothetical protein